MSEGRKAGRPPKSAKGPANVILTMRVRPELYDEIREEAERNGRSISDQAERRLIRRENNVVQLIDLAISTVESRLGDKKWTESDHVKHECRAAVRVIVDLIFGVADETSDDKIDEIIENGSSEDIKRRIETLSTALEVYDYALGKDVPK